MKKISGQFNGNGLYIPLIQSAGPVVGVLVVFTSETLAPGLLISNTDINKNGHIFSSFVC